MKSDSPDTLDERLLEQLVAFEEDGERPSRSASGPLAAALSCVDMLHQVWPDPGAAAALESPELLGRFRVVRKLGEGGGGLVFLAQDPILKREVALKVPRPEALLTSALRQRFLREARAAAALNHPNIVKVLDTGDAGLVCFIVNEYCPGTDLKSWLKGLRSDPKAAWDLSIPAAIRLVAKLADAMDYTHRQGILHRDLKPSNVLLTSIDPDLDPSETRSLDDLVPHISDFGLAKIADPEATQDAATRQGSVFGTPQYMAPEQAQGRVSELGPAVDIYALGVILYELLTGRPPFQAESEADLLYRVIHDVPAPLTPLRPTIHRDLQAIVMKCLHKEPAERYASAGDLAQDLRDFISGVPIRARALPWWRRVRAWGRRHPAQALATALSVVLIMALAGLSYVQWQLNRSEVQRQESEKMTVLAIRAQEEARRSREAAEEAAHTQKYFALLSRAEELETRKKIGWRAQSLDLLREAGKIETKSRDPLALRVVAARVLAGVDLAEKPGARLLFRPHNLCFIPGSKKLAAAQSRAIFPYLSCSVVVLDGATGKLERNLSFKPEHLKDAGLLVPDGARCMGVSPSGRYLGVGARSGFLHVWDLDNPAPTPIISVNENGSPIERVLFVNDNTLITYSGPARLVQSWRFEKNARVTASLNTSPGRLGLDLNPARDLLACISGDHVLFLNPDTLKPAREPLHTRADAFRFHPHPGVAAIQRDNRILIVDWLNNRLVRRLPSRELRVAHDGPLEDLFFNQDGSLMISACSSEEDRRVKIWSVAAGECLMTLTAGASGPLPVAWCNTSNCLAVSGADNVQFHQLTGLHEEKFAAFFPRPLQRLRYRSDGAVLATSGSYFALAPLNDTGARAVEEPAKSFVALWDNETGKLRRLYMNAERGGPDRSSLLYHPHDQTLLARGSTSVSFFDAAESPRKTRPARDADVWAFNANGTVLWGFCSDGWLRSWSWPDCKPGPEWDNRFARVVTGKMQIYALAAGKARVLAGGRDGQVRVLRAADATLEKVIAPMGRPIRALCFLKDESRAVVSSQKGELRLVTIPGGETLDSREDHTDAIETLALHPDGRLLASGGRDGAVHLYDLAEGRLKLVLSLQAPGPVLSVDFHPDGKRLALAVQGDLAPRVWRLDRLASALRNLGLDEKDWPHLAEGP